MSLTYRVDFKMPLRAHIALLFLLLVTPLVTHGGLPSAGCSNTEWKLPDLKNNIIPNFSRVGYRQGHVKIPIVPVKKTLKPLPEPFESDDTVRIQKALDEVGDLPLVPLGRDGIMVRGAVLLTKGVYRVTRALIISKSGVVLRGEGPDALSGTTILCRRQKQGDFILINAALDSENARSRIEPEYASRYNDYQAMPGTKIRNGIYIPVGTTVLPVDDAVGFDVDDKIVVEIGGSKEWIAHIGMDASSYPWHPSGLVSKFERKIVDIDRNERTLTIDIPMVMNIDPQYPPRTAKIYHYVYQFNNISDVGVENLRLSRDGPGIRRNTMHALIIDNTINGWVSDVSTDGFMLGIEASEFSSFITIQNCKVDCQGRGWVSPETERAGFTLNGQMSLVNHCTADRAVNDFTSDGPSRGPNVFVDSRGRSSSGPTGPRRRWVTGTLYDNMISDYFRSVNRPSDGLQTGWTERGWTGAFNVFYNCEAEGGDSKIESAPGTTNWIIGFRGLPEDYFEWWKESKIVCSHSVVQPRSLYWSQLAERTGQSTDELMRMNGDARDYSTAEDPRRPSGFRRICKRLKIPLPK